MSEFLPLGDLVNNVTTKISGRAKDPDVPYVGLEHLETDSRTVRGSVPASMSVSVNTVFRRDDTLFGKLRPNLRKVALAEFDGYCSTDILVLRAKPEVDASFANHLLRSGNVLRHAARRAFGTKMPRTSWSDLSEFHVPVPERPVQQEVAAILNAVEGEIARLESAVHKARLLHDGLVSELLVRGVRSESARDATLLGSIPGSWEVAPLASRKTDRRPYLKTGPFGSSLKQEHWVDVGVPVVTIGSLGDGVFVPSELLHVSPRTAEQLSAYCLREGDIVFSRVADVGRSVVVSAQENGWLMSSNMMWISLDPRRANARFVRANIAGNPRIRRQIRRLVNTAGRDVANAKIMNQLQFPWPSLSEQDEIAEIIDHSQERLVGYVRELKKIELIKLGLANDLFSMSPPTDTASPS
jgi:type I restriction enzyme S subunit